MHIRSLAGLGLVLLGFAACGGGEGFASRTYLLDWGSYQVASGQEGVRCVTLDLGNDKPIKVREIRNVLSSGTVQLIVYRLDSGTVNAVPTECQPFIDSIDPAAGTPLMLTMRPEETLALPAGVAFSLGAHQKIRLQLQFLNPTAGPVNVTATTEFRTMDESSFEQEAGFLVAGNLNISLSPGVSQVGPKWIPYPQALGGARVFAVTGLTHKLGTYVEAAFAASQAGSFTTLYQPVAFDWSAPPVALLTPAAVLPAGGGFRLTCEYNNQTGATVTFGFTPGSEICFFGAYYYPKQAATVIL